MPDSLQALRMIGLRELAMTEPEDIVERLLSVADLDARSGEPLGKACRDAAAEIRRLRAALESARAEQKEACARVAETKAKRASFIKGTPPNVEVYKWSDGPAIAAAIRAME